MGTHAQTGYTGARPPAQPGAPPRLTPPVFTLITRVTTGSAPLTPPAPPRYRPRLASGGPGLSTLAAPLHPSRGQEDTTSWASKEAFSPNIRNLIKLVMCKYSLKENIYLDIKKKE